jgi:hypothetical protein
MSNLGTTIVEVEREMLVRAANIIRPMEERNPRTTRAAMTKRSERQEMPTPAGCDGLPCTGVAPTSKCCESAMQHQCEM